MSVSPILQASNLSCGYRGEAIVSNINVEIKEGVCLVILGPNGVGKTTFFKTILGFIPLVSGSMSVCGRSISELSRKEIARMVAYVPQSHDAAFGYSAREMVLMGRTPLLVGLSNPNCDDEAATDSIIESLQLSSVAEESFSFLSEGQQQMILITRAMVSSPKLLVMDEPCASLDWGNQMMVLDRLRRLADDGLSVLLVTHDPNHALMLDAEVLCLNADGSKQSGHSRDVLTDEVLSGLYGISVASGFLRSGMRACMPLMEGRGSR